MKKNIFEDRVISDFMIFITKYSCDYFVHDKCWSLFTIKILLLTERVRI